MKKNLIIFGIAFFLVLVGFSGCNEKTNNQNIVSFKELIEHLPKYIGKNVTIEGYVLLSPSINIASMTDSQSNPKYVMMLNVPDSITMYTGMYRITGTVDFENKLSEPIIYVISAEVI